MVTMFMFYSGYGIYESIKKNKKDYIKRIPKKRILITLIHFDVAVLTFAIVNYFTGHQNTFFEILSAMTGWGGIGNSNWYIFAILCLYLGTYISFQLFDKNNKKALIANWAITILTMITIAAFRTKANAYCYNTLLCYPLGMTWSFYKEKINSFLFNNKKYLFVLVPSIIFFLGIKRLEHVNTIYFIISSTLFVIIVLLLTMKVNLTSKILKWFGDNLFWIYILQRIPMLILSRLGYQNTHAYRFAAIAFVTTILLSVIYHWLFKRVDKLILKEQN